MIKKGNCSEAQLWGSSVNCFLIENKYSFCSTYIILRRKLTHSHSLHSTHSLYKPDTNADDLVNSISTIPFFFINIITPHWIKKATWSALVCRLLLSQPQVSSFILPSSVLLSLDPVAGLKATHWDSSLKIWCPWHTFPMIHLPRYSMSNISPCVTKLTMWRCMMGSNAAHSSVLYSVSSDLRQDLKPPCFLLRGAEIGSVRSVMLDGELDRISTLCTVCMNQRSKHIEYDTAH